MALIKEGKAEIFLEKFRPYKGPGKRQAGFYNPTLEIDRDINVIFCQYIVKKGARNFLDGLASTGIRGIRIVKEVEGDFEMDINDLNKKAFGIIKKNIEINGIDANALNENFCILMHKKKYDYVDIDPYGSPIPFLSCLFRGIKRKAYVSITATDTATLCGVYKTACIRKYGAIPLRGQSMKEIGIRILLGYIARQAGGFDYKFHPILSYVCSHFFRIYGVLEKGAKKSNECINKIGWVYWDNGWKICEFEKPPAKKFAGPLWIGNLHDKNFLDEMPEILKEKKFKSQNEKEIKKLITYFKNEIILPPLFYESNFIAKELKRKQPKLNYIIEKLKEKGYLAGRSHFAPNAFKTNAPYNDIVEIWK